MSTKFTDAKGREWEVFATPTECDLVQDACGFNFYDLTNKKTAVDLVFKLETDDEFMRDVLWCCCHPEGIDKNEFRSGIYGEALDRGLEAFFLVLPSFYRSRNDKEVITNLLALMQHVATKNKQIAEVLGEKSTKLIAEVIDGIDAKQLVENSMSSAMNLPDSQELTSSRQTEKDRGDTVSVS